MSEIVSRTLGRRSFADLSMTVKGYFVRKSKHRMTMMLVRPRDDNPPTFFVILRPPKDLAVVPFDQALAKIE
jgi:hypothetical protein